MNSSALYLKLARDLPGAPCLRKHTLIVGKSLKPSNCLFSHLSFRDKISFHLYLTGYLGNLTETLAMKALSHL